MRRALKLIVAVAVVLLLAGTIFLGFGQRSPQAETEDHQHESLAEQYTCGMHPMIISDEPGSCPICGMDLTPIRKEPRATSSAENKQRQIKYWQAPMDPTYIRDQPGKSPMGMDLVPVYEDQASGGSIITIDPTTIQNMGVRTTKVIRGDLSQSIRTIGLISYEEPKQYVVNTKVAGWVEKLYVTETGQQVKQGQRLLEIYSPDLVTAQQELLLALNNFKTLKNNTFPQIAENARRLLDSSRKRLKLWDVSDRQIKALEETGQVKKTVTLYARHSGIVTKKQVNEGTYVKPGMTLLNLADLSKVWVLADIYEYQLPWVKVGQPVRVELPYNKNRQLTAHIDYIYPFVEPKTRTVKARIEFDNADQSLRPEMYVNVYLAGETLNDVLIIPQETVLYSGEEQTVFVAQPGGRFEPRLVKTGLQGKNGHVEVVQGLFEGELVVTSAQFMLDSESKLREAIQKMRNPTRLTPPDNKTEADLDDLFSDAAPKTESNIEDLFN